MLILDARQNIAFNAQQLGRDHKRWAWQTRQSEAQSPRPPATNSLPDGLLAGVGIVFGGIRAVPERDRSHPAWQPHSYRTLGDARLLSEWQIDHYHRLADDSDSIQLIQTRADLDAVIASWDAEKPLDAHSQGIVPMLDGADAIADPLEIEEWHERGLRIIAPAGGTTRFCGNAAEDGDLSALGYELLEAMAGHGMLLDIANMSDRACLNAIERYEGAIIASHANPRHFRDSPRCLSDAAIRALAERNGAIGIMVYNRYLRRDWHFTDPQRRVSLSHWVDAVDYVCQLTGSAAHVGLGSDIDGGYALRALPHELDSAADLWLLEEALRDRGFGEDEMAAILSGNMLRQLRRALPDG